MLQQTRYFTPLYEVVDKDDSQKLIHYFSSPTGIFAIFTIENGNNGRMKYVLKDHQGSLAALVNEKSGTEYFSFDAWGRRRNAQTWAYTNMPISFGTTRGFTMHEHLDEFKLINMNGRVYDPLVGRFISPDPFVQLPDYSQSYNRYSYAFNNPLRFSDPSGFFAEGDSTLSPAQIPPPMPYPPGTKLKRSSTSTNTDNSSLGQPFKGTETTLPTPYQQSKLSMDAEGNANEVAQSQGCGNWSDTYNYNRIGFVPLDQKVGYQMANYRMNFRASTGMVPIIGKDYSIQGQQRVLTISAISRTTLVSGDVSASASATLMINGNTISSQSLLPTGTSLVNAGSYYIGSASFNIPTSGIIQVGLKGGWVVSDPGGRSVPVYHPIGAPIPININTTITIPGL